MDHSFANWILAARLQTLPAAITPVIVGSAIAQSENSFSLAPAILCAVFAVLVQVGTNFANDYYDWKQGADNEERKGPTRLVAAGLIAPHTMKRAAFATLAISFLIGLSLVYWGGYWLVFIGIVSVVSAVGYTAQPIALGYRGLGDIFVITFFGLVAVSFTAYVQLGYFPPEGWFVGLSIGLLTNNLLVVNNYRDRETDKAAGKKTLIVRFGPGIGEHLVLASLISGLLVSLGFAFINGYWFTLPAILGLYPVYTVWKRLPRALRRSGFSVLLKKSSTGLFLFGILLSIGLVVS
ncbi:MAG: 1,4-dihydroxy-2-naphthoate polyprenyltransferase [Verrucomicrobiota bacterium]